MQADRLQLPVLGHYKQAGGQTRTKKKPDATRNTVCSTILDPKFSTPRFFTPETEVGTRHPRSKLVMVIQDQMSWLGTGKKKIRRLVLLEQALFHNIFKVGHKIIGIGQ